MGPTSTRIYEFGDFRLDRSKRLLERGDGSRLSLTPKAYDTLAYLVEHAGTVLDKDELMRALWPGTSVEENNLTQNISALRRVLGDGHGEHRYIVTVPGRGYQFVAPVKFPAANASRNEGPAEQSIAVLPFVNLSGDPGFDCFAEGLAEELINALARLELVRVAARRSAFFFKNRQADVREIAEKLGVTFLLEGSLRCSGGRLRITAQLINTANGYHLWSDRYEREAEIRDLIEVQDEITLAIVDALKPKMTGGERSGVLKHHTSNAAVHELYLKGRFHLFRMTPTGIRSGMIYLQQATQADPSDAHVQVGLAHAYRMSALSLEMPPNDYLPKAKAAADRAIDLDPNLAEAHAVLGFTVFWYEWAWDGAERYLRRALELNPRSADAHWMFGHMCSNTGRHEEALAEMALARELDPLSGLIHAMEGKILLNAGRTDQALARLREALELDPNSRVAHSFLASACIEKGFLEEAVSQARAAATLCPGSADAASLEAYANAKLGRRGGACAALDHLLFQLQERYVPPYRIAIVYNGLDQVDEALTWLEYGFERRDPRMVELKVEPRWKNLRHEPRFIRLLKEMRFSD
jgi:TolB-like protein/Tfp pilus assembly protein PilF